MFDSKNKSDSIEVDKNKEKKKVENKKKKIVKKYIKE